MDHNFKARYQNVRIRPLAKGDIEALRLWRNDASKTRFLRPLGEITPQMQENWFYRYLDSPDEYIFAIDETERLGRMVGSVALYDVHGNVAEVGKIQIGDAAANGRGIGRTSKVMAMWIGFRKLGLKKIVNSVHRDNRPAYINDLRVGFRIVGEHPAPVPAGGVEDEMEIDEKRLLEVNPFVTEIILN